MISRVGWFSKGAALIGAGLGVGVVLIVAIGQLRLDQVLSGNMPLEVAVSIGSNAFPFLSLLLLIFIIAGITVFWRNRSQVWVGLIWLGAAGVVAYCVYLSRFSLGPMLIPSVVLLTVAGLLAIWWRR